MCILEFVLNSVAFLPPGGVEGPPGDSYLQSYFLGFLLCTAWRLCAARQATPTGLPILSDFGIFVMWGYFGSDSYDIRILGMVNCYLKMHNW